MSLSFWRDDDMKFSATLALIALNLVVFLLQIMQPREFEIYFGLNYLFFEKNLFFQPLSSFFLHANFTHLAMNMAVLWSFGSQIETRFGAIKFVSIYIIGGVLTALFSLVFISFGASGGHFINVVGASGAICVLFGVYAGVLRGVRVVEGLDASGENINRLKVLEPELSWISSESNRPSINASEEAVRILESYGVFLASVDLETDLVKSPIYDSLSAHYGIVFGTFNFRTRHDL